MKGLLLALIVLTISGCKNREDELKERVLPIITQALLKDSVVTKIDSLVIIKIDTLTDLKDSTFKLVPMYSTYDFLQSQRDHYLELAKLEVESAKLSQQQARLYYHVLGSKELSDISKDQTKDYIAKSQEYIDSADVYDARIKSLLKRIAAIDKKIKSKGLDSVTFRGYIVNYRFKGPDKNNVAVKNDDYTHLLNQDFRIINFSNYNRYKRLNGVNIGLLGLLRMR